MKPSLAGPRSAAPPSPVAFRLTTRNHSARALRRMRRSWHEGGVRVQRIVAGPPVVTVDTAIDKPVNISDTSRP